MGRYEHGICIQLVPAGAAGGQLPAGIASEKKKPTRVVGFILHCSGAQVSVFIQLHMISIFLLFMEHQDVHID